LRAQASKPTADILRLITKNLTEMVLAYDMARKLVFVNPAVETLTGYSIEELEQANFICWIHADDQPRMLKLWDHIFQGNSFHDEEYRLITKDGRVKWVVASWSPIVDDSGAQVGVQGREFDLTQRKLAETALRHSEEKLRADEERYRGLFDNSPFPMWEEDFSEIKNYLDSLSAAGVSDLRRHLTEHREALDECIRRVRILDVNRAAQDFYGADSKDQLLIGLAGIFDERALDVFREEMATLAENRSSFQIEFHARTLRGEQRLVDMIVSIVDSARADWSRVIVAFFDITDRKRLEEQFVQSQKMESLGRLAGGVAHDFNNFLTVINAYSDWILGEMEADNPFRERIAAIHRAGVQCAELTQQLLAFGRKQLVRPMPLNLNSLISESRRVLDRVLGDDIQIHTLLAPDLGTIEADRTQMNQVLMNLAVNALEAMPNGGTLTIETRNRDEAPEIVLEIRDTGHGMDERTRRHLFEPFFTTKKGSKNAGLGLSIVFGIVSHAGGRIEVQSRPDEGAAVRIYLPRSQSPLPAGDDRKPVTVEPARFERTVLVVEDRPEVRAVTCGMVEQLGYRVLGAANGAEAVTIAQHHQGAIPLLLTDVVMPGMNGREVAEHLCQIKPEMKVVYMSGFTGDLLTETGKLDALTSYLQKPFTLAELAETLRAAG
jgi:two-component system, cell cycle sensor histidine kinase and response regulator CckA